MAQPISLDNLARSSESDEGGLELGQVLAAIRRRILLVAGITTVVVSAALLKALTDTPTYQSRFEMLATPTSAEAQVISSIPDTLSSTQEPSAVVLDETKLRVLKSPDVINPVVEELQVQYPDITYDVLVAELSIVPLQPTILEVGYRSTDPDRVQAVLSAIAQAYLDYSLESRRVDIQRGIQFVEEQLPQIEDRVQTLEDQLQRFRQEYSLIDPEAQGQQLTDQINNYREQLLANRVELRQAQTIYVDLQNQLASQPQETASSSALSENSRYQTLLDELLELDQQIAQDSALFLDESPDLQILRDKRQNLLPLLQQEGQRAQADVLSRIRDLEARDRALTQAIASLETTLDRYPELARRHTEIQRNLQIATENLNQFLAKREALRIDSAQREVPWQLLTPPGAPVPSVTSVKQNLVLGTLLGVILGLAAALAVDLLSGVLYTAKDAKNLAKLPLLGVIPFNKELEESTSALDFSAVMQQMRLSIRRSNGNGAQPAKSTPFYEAFRLLFTNLRLLNSTALQRSFVISSAAPDDGKSTVALYLAQAAAGMGQRVLLVETDLRRPSLQYRLDLSEVRGLTDVMAGKICLKDAIQRLPLDENLFVLPAGSIAHDPTRVLASQSMREIIDQLRSMFNLIIYDAPPLVGFADSYLMAAHADGILLVVGLGKLKRSLLEKALDELEVSGVPVVGIVANGAQDKAPQVAYYQYEALEKVST
jgi:capsular exopolysaccharide synthesis family protein